MGPLNTFKALQLLKHLNKEEKAIAKKALQRNAFFAHPDQLILSMCADEDEIVMQKAIGMIRRLRQKIELQDDGDDYDDNDSDEFTVDEELLVYSSDESASEEEDEDFFSLDSTVRKVIILKLKWQARTYHNMINWKLELKTKPPFIAKLSDEELLKILDLPLQLPKWSNHTQAVERGIKLVTESCTAVTGAIERDGYIRQRMHSRKLMPKFNTKKEFNHHI